MKRTPIPCRLVAPIALGAAMLLAPAALTAQEVFLVADIDSSPPPAATLTNIGNQLVEFQGALYFMGCDSAAGCELWKTDGTLGGSVRVANINPGSSGSSPNSFTVMGATLYFVATRAAEGAELWKTDGTEVGTALVKDIRPGTSSSFVSEPTVVGSTLFFRASDGTNGAELWKSDGTEAGTQMVANVNPGSASASPAQLAQFGSSILFYASDGSTGYEPWVSDGSGPGTVRLADVRPGTASSAISPLLDGPFFAVLGGQAYFGANDGTGWALWKTDGTPGGTAEVADLGIAGTSDRVIGSRAVGTRVLVAVRDVVDSTFGQISQGILWSSDGTPGGTEPIATFETALDRRGTLTVPVEYAGAAYFLGATRDTGLELWTTDGSGPGTTLVKEIWPGAASGAAQLFTTPAGLVLAAYGPDTGYEAWVSDGTAEGTLLPRDSYPGLANGAASFFSTGTTTAIRPGALGGSVYYVATSANSAFRTLLASDGTPGGTEEVLLIGSVGASGGQPAELARFGTRVLFSARDAASGREPWISDGSAAGTSQLADLAGGTAGSDPRFFTQLGALALFSAWTPATGRELFVTDGTPGGTALLADIEAGAASSDPADFVAWGSVVLFRACDTTAGCELWKSDGTVPGTQRVADLVAGSGGSFPERLVAGPVKAFFRATTPASGTELWATDGSAAGTGLLAEIGPGATSSLPQDLEATPSRVFFGADDDSHGLEVWSSDGTPGGTALAKDAAAGPADGVYASDDYAAVHQGHYYFSLPFDSGTGWGQLWKSDGTTPGTVLVKDSLALHASGGDFGWLGSGGDFLWFTFWPSNNNSEPYRSDGTPGGTALVEEIRSGTTGSSPYGYFGYGGNAYFMADGPDGRRLYRGSGFAGETVALGPTGAAGVAPIVIPPYFPLVEAGGTLYFVASTTADGRELFAYGLPILVTGFEGAGFTAWDVVVGAVP